MSIKKWSVVTDSIKNVKENVIYQEFLSRDCFVEYQIPLLYILSTKKNC